ncbi:uncharacterized protein LOC130640857 [Hydractinia symbiolongicarpus]|uniref:uncharacterized protein LOC130640857 n=1 Tax=Hydractinia symbiolongicarpus TaxID=13093 RepID=UPI00254C4911|nr:uncharacterized protein LOC130640857 [Hydractinia symbiolongicarpus]
MVMITTAIKLVIAEAIFLFLCLACFATSLASNVWWLSNTADKKTTLGLWKTCVEMHDTTNCSNRKNILSFKDERGGDPIILCLLLSIFFTLLTVDISFGMVCCCKKSLHLWQRCVKWNAVLGIIAVISSVDAMLYSELEFKKLLQEGERGWSYMVALAGTGLQMIGYVLLFCQLCIKTYMPIDRMHAW